MTGRPLPQNCRTNRSSAWLRSYSCAWSFVSRTSRLNASCGLKPNRVKAGVSTDPLNEGMWSRRR